MKILTIGFLILVMMSGQLNADENATLNKITLTLDDTSEVLVKGFIAPIGEAMSESSFKEWDELVNLRVAEPEKRYPASVFHAFLPDTPVSIGESWKVEEEGALTLLRQLHPNPSLDMHINVGDSRGLWACLRAYDDKFADIVFRIHAEFKLEDGWFTPSQFAGHLVIDRIEEKVAFFEMSVPDGPINFDVNWKRNKYANHSIVAGGFCQMELRAGTQDLLENVEFTASILQETAEHTLIQRFYKSQQINWVLPEQVLEIAQTQQKPIHAISIDGPLMDESC
ncbi:MAG: hypothetical protein OXI61_00375 [Candidatus Poribacteria bacterium]|nr:hypothetical protein [Candidatus Poribacteria bacterium]